MVVGVLSYVVKVWVAIFSYQHPSDDNPKKGYKSSRNKLTVVFSTSTNTLLTVGGTDELGKLGFGVCGAQEEGLVLVHTLSLKYIRTWI